MDNINQEWYPDKNYLNNIKKEIDRILDNNSLFNYPFYEGAGRTVVIIDKVAVKIPEFHELAHIEGTSQNKKEYEIYMKTKHPRLNPIYDKHRDCLICKEVMADISVLEEKYHFKYEDILARINKGVSELSDVISNYNLYIEDITAPRNWGYDFSIKRFVCVDYGI